MTRNKRQMEIRQFYGVLAAELDSHIANGSGFIFQGRFGDDAPEDVVTLRLGILRRVVRALERKSKP